MRHTLFALVVVNGLVCIEAAQAQSAYYRSGSTTLVRTPTGRFGTAGGGTRTSVAPVTGPRNVTWWSVNQGYWQGPQNGLRWYDSPRSPSDTPYARPGYRSAEAIADRRTASRDYHVRAVNQPMPPHRLDGRSTLVPASATLVPPVRTVKPVDDVDRR